MLFTNYSRTILMSVNVSYSKYSIADTNKFQPISCVCTVQYLIFIFHYS